MNDVSRKNIHEIKNKTDIPWYVLTKIIALDFRGRNKIPDLKRLLNQSQNNLLGCHPLDIINIIYLCMDPFLAQKFTEKLMMCQLSVPLLLPNPEQKESKLLKLSLIHI